MLNLQYICIKLPFWEKIFGMKTVFIVGASSGIGYATADKFSKENYRVINLSRKECNLPGVINFCCDVTDRKILDESLNKITSEYRIDCFIYSAGFSMAAPLEYVKEGDYRYLYEVNFFAFVHCLQILIPSLRKTAGTACIISSIGAIQPIPFDCYYSSSKAALNMLCATLRYELEADGINIISVMPGGTKTGFTQKRKIYSPAEADGYTKQMHLAVDSLAKMEQSGMDAKKVANTVFYRCENACMSHTFSSGLKNKLIALFVKLMPQSVCHFIGKFMFFSEDNE